MSLERNWTMVYLYVRQNAGFAWAWHLQEILYMCSTVQSRTNLDRQNVSGRDRQEEYTRSRVAWQESQNRSILTLSCVACWVDYLVSSTRERERESNTGSFRPGTALLLLFFLKKLPQLWTITLTTSIEAQGPLYGGPSTISGFTTCCV